MKILHYGHEHTFLDERTGLLYRDSTLRQTARPHTHAFYEVFAVIAGTALHMVNDTIQTLQQGDFVFIRPHDVHSYEFHHSDDFRIVNIGYSVPLHEEMKRFLSAEAAFKRLEREEIPPLVRLEGDELSRLQDDFAQIGRAMKTHDAANTVRLAKCHLARGLLHFLRAFGSDAMRPAASGSAKWFQLLLAEMNHLANLRQGYPRMLKLAGCTPNHLCRLFRKFEGQTPTAYLNRKRLDYATYYLVQTSTDILAISESCGFKNLSHFYHLFKARHHCSPLQFRLRAAGR